MANADMPFVAVIGGLSQLNATDEAAAKAAAQEIGAELAKANFGLVVYFSTDESLEPHVVSGYVPALAAGAGEIRVRIAEPYAGQVKFKEEATARDGLFDPDHFPGKDWEAPFYRSLAEEEGFKGERVDAVLLLGGANTTFIAGQIAAARRLPILAVNRFGGSAGRIWSQLAQASPGKHPSWGTRSAADFVKQLKKECDDAAARRKEARRREQVLTDMLAQRQKTQYAAVAFVILLAVLLLGMTYTRPPSAWPFVMFAGLVSAGATGALIRMLLWESGETDARRSLLLGSVAGLVVGLAYLIPQWVGAPDVLAPKADTAVTATDKIQLVSVVLVALSAGVGFDTVFSRLQSQAKDYPVGPPR
jgi:hypothetical protein